MTTNKQTNNLENFKTKEEKKVFFFLGVFE